MSAPRDPAATWLEFGRRARPIIQAAAATITTAMRELMPVIERAAADARSLVLDGDHPERDEIRAQVTVAQLQSMAVLADRGEA